MGSGLNMEKIQKRIVRIVSMEEALEDVIPFQYSQEVLTGRRKIVLTVDPDLKKKGCKDDRL